MKDKIKEAIFLGSLIVVSALWGALMYKLYLLYKVIAQGVS